MQVSTKIQPEKLLREVTAIHNESGLEVMGYEIHNGQTHGPDCQRPFGKVNNQPEGACSLDGRVQGSYLHGLFCSDAFRQFFLKQLGAPASDLYYNKVLDDIIDRLADHIETHLEVEAILDLAG